MNQAGHRISCFKAYDIRGRVPDDLNEERVFAIGQAYAALVKPRRVAVGRDMRLSSPSLSRALIRGLTESGAEVFDIGLCGTEQVYFATFDLELDGGIMVTASHNPADYNGMKLVREKAKPISGDSGLREIEALVAGGDLATNAVQAINPGRVQKVDFLDRYVTHLLSYINSVDLKPLKVVCNAGNGGAGLVIEQLEKHLPFRFSKLFFAPDGTFPNGVPNPLLPENRRVTAEAVLREGADVGIAWDGDYDRCFFFDEEGSFIEGYYIVGLLAGHLLKQHPGAKIIHDPRLTWNTIEIVREAGGVPVQSKTGHAFIKERMRAEDALYGGEMSAHHYFRDFTYCDSGMLPWLMVLEIMSKTGKKLSELVEERRRRYPISGEINRRVDDPFQAIARVRAKYENRALAVDETDGISLEFENWRFNLRMSNTEPVIRLNVESRGDATLVKQKTDEIIFQLDIPGTPS
jgi:phosphomannomutase/phosphomannomutase/phosphoglucomutase